MGVKSQKSRSDSKLDSTAQPPNYWDLAKPYLARIAPCLRAVSPYCSKAYCQVLQLNSAVFVPYIYPYWDILYPLIMLLFGGQFALCLLAYQAFKMSGGRQIELSWNELKLTWKESIKNLEGDDEAKKLLDEDGDGEITFVEIVSVFCRACTADTLIEKQRNERLISVTLKCIDPNRISEAFAGFWVGLVAVLACLKSAIAQCLAIGAQIGEKACNIVAPLVRKPLHEKYPEHTRWVDVGIKSAFAVVGVLVSIFLTKIVTAFNCAMQGAEKLSDQLIDFARGKGWMSEESLARMAAQRGALSTGLVIFGLGFQWAMGFSVPIFLKIPLAPLLLAEYALAVVSYW